jgi:hypothetical protein
MTEVQAWIVLLLIAALVAGAFIAIWRDPDMRR